MVAVASFYCPVTTYEEYVRMTMICWRCRVWNMCKSFGGGGSLVVVVASAIVHTENLVVTAIDALPLLQ